MANASGVPERVREAFGETLVGEGVEVAWRARWVTLDRRRMCDVWAEDEAAVMGAIERYVDGDPI